MAGDEYVFLMVYDFIFPQTKLSKPCMHYICSVPMLFPHFGALDTEMVCYGNC